MEWSLLCRFSVLKLSGFFTQVEQCSRPSVSLSSLRLGHWLHGWAPRPLCPVTNSQTARGFRAVAPACPGALAAQQSSQFSRVFSLRNHLPESLSVGLAGLVGLYILFCLQPRNSRGSDPGHCATQKCVRVWSVAQHTGHYWSAATSAQKFRMGVQKL